MQTATSGNIRRKYFNNLKINNNSDIVIHQIPNYVKEVHGFCIKFKIFQKNACQ